MSYEKTENINFIKNEYLYKFIAFVLSFLLILNTNSIWTTIPDIKNRFINSLYFILPICVFINLFNIKMDRIKFRNTLMLLMFFFYIFVSTYLYQLITIRLF